MVVDKVRRQNFHGRAGSLAYGNHALIKMLSPAVGQVVPGDRRDNDMFQAKAMGCLGDAFRLVGLKFFRAATLDGAETAASCANIPQNHEGRRFLGITFHSVWTLGIVADGFQVQFFEQPGSEMIGVALGNFAFEPSR